MAVAELFMPEECRLEYESEATSGTNLQAGRGGGAHRQIGGVEDGPVPQADFAPVQKMGEDEH
eukprot:5585729-Prorocentrum_lima.AAC.1